MLSLQYKVLPMKAAFRVVKAFAETDDKPNPPTASPAASDSPASVADSAGLPEPLQKTADFFMREDFTLSEWEFYNTNLKKYIESDLYQKSTGFKKIPEIVNGRIAMVGWLTGSLAELLGGGTMYKQLAAGPGIILAFAVLITVASIVPVYKEVDDAKVKELADQYTLPMEAFTPKMEQFHARVAMTAMAIFFLVEAVKGSAIF